MSYRFKLRSMAIIEVEDSWSYIWIYVYLSWKWIRLSEALASNEMCYWKVMSKRELISPNLPQSQGISDLEVDQGWLGQKKKVVLFPEIGQMKNFLSLTLPHSRMCIRINLFQTKKTHNQKAKETKENRKIKETNEEKEKGNVVVVNNICEKSIGTRWYRLTICSVYF